MEAFCKLEKTQRTISWMQTRNLSSNNNQQYSDRLLADFLLFMAKPCGTLKLEEKCNLISEFLPKISPALLEEFLPCVIEEEEDNQELCLDNKMALVGLDAMQRANSTLEDFMHLHPLASGEMTISLWLVENANSRRTQCRSYFMFHGMDANKPKSVFKYLPMLSFTESYIYQLDSLNEEISNLSAKGTSSATYMMERNPQFTDNFVEAFKTAPFEPLVYLLEYHGLLTERIREEFKCGEEYWHLERKLCHALMNKNEIMVEDVMRAIRLKSFDYRVLNLLLYQLNGKQVNDLVMEFLSISEFLVEVSDDFYKPCAHSPSKTSSCRLGGHGGDRRLMFPRAKHITEAEKKYECISKTLDPDLSLNYRRRCEEATKEGGNMSGPLGTWNIPPVIASEDIYRSNLLNSKYVSPPI
ncbi:hypothetical protein GIB67_043040 [Kingdonia uniflora]|uniref:Uncharacterized protein n=1 Tax=Kingdonia uniflora TaxID=39325 RepID=A0A7J7NTI2_9MAGN|nr:hypothetical protein GIB67_043040 [Kingdonia uniflora]